jgi:hypothetical protein
MLIGAYRYIEFAGANTLLSKLDSIKTAGW